MALMINGVRLDDSNRCYVIAEAAGSHNQDFATAEALVRAAADVGADAVKFQTFTAEDICVDMPFPFGHDTAHDAWARGLGVTSIRDLFRLGGLPLDWHKPLKSLAESLGIAFLSTPFSVDAARFLVEEIGVPALKIASGDLTFTPLLEYAACSGLPVILSTGGATCEEVRKARDVLDEISQYEVAGMVIMHCVSVYPCRDEIANLSAITRLQNGLCECVGFSDHTLSYDLVPALAVACGATVLEKHLRLAEDTSSIDAAHSLPPYHFARYVESARQASVILGDGIKKPHALELHDRAWARRDPSDWLRPTAAARYGAWE
jgi:sialic acid synthase SpsE